GVTGVGISQAYRRRIEGAFGARGRAWLDELPELVDRYAAAWRLRDLQPNPEPSYAWIAYASSPSGPAVLKLICPNEELLSEADALSELDASVMCRLLADDRANGALLLERLDPGTPLRARRSFDERLEAAAEVFARLHAVRDRPVGKPREADRPAGPAPVHPRYLEQASRAFDVARAEAARRGLRYATALVAAEPPGTPERLLHADLHHDNILRSGEEWRVIDPKGAFGPRALEAGRFIINQLGESAPEVRSDEFERMVVRFAEALRVPEAGVAAGAALDATVSACWSLEDGEPYEAVAGAGRRALEVQRLADRWVE
ncbi:MAG: aminoglycoside phosphotransferase family protein, partial [Spirochaetota bacterium]